MKRQDELRSRLDRYRRRVGHVLRSAGRQGGAGRAAGDGSSSATSDDAAGSSTYELHYERHAQVNGDDGVGGGDYDVVGEIELDVLRAAGLQPGSTLLDFGCGNGRLAVHAVPYLAAGTYIGTDVSRTFLLQAAARIAGITPPPTAQVRWIHQNDVDFGVAADSIDVLCAYSVFTHMDHEEMFRYLQAMHAIVRRGGRVVLSCLPLQLADARHIFRTEAGFAPEQRWQRVRNVTTSVDLVESIVAMADWSVQHWLHGDEPQAASTTGEMRSLGQSIVILSH